MFFFCFFFFNDTATTEIYTLSLHDALPISLAHRVFAAARRPETHLDDPVPGPLLDRGEHRPADLLVQPRGESIGRLLTDVFLADEQVEARQVGTDRDQEVVPGGGGKADQVAQPAQVG